MKKIILSLIIIFLNNQIIFSQRNLNEVEKLTITAKVWGFLKYYHPQVAKGVFDWDNQLINILPKVVSANSSDELSKVYLDWINSLGEIKPCKSCKRKSKDNYFIKNLDLDWIQDSSLFSHELSDKLIYIENNRIQGENYYIKAAPARNIKVVNEKLYKNIDFPSQEYRLLGLFRYWNIIEYFFPYKYMVDQNWEDVLIEMIPKFQKVSDIENYHLTIKELIAKLDDSHTWINFNEKKKNRLPVTVNFIEEKIVITKIENDSLAKIDDLKIGDIILNINGVSAQDMIHKNLKYRSASNLNFKYFRVSNDILSGFGDTINLTFERNGKIINKKTSLYENLKLDYYTKTDINRWKMINDDIAYINLGKIKKVEVINMMKSLMNSKVLILDVRNPPRYTLYNIVRWLNNSKKEFTKVIKPEFTYPGKFSWKKPNLTGRTKDAYGGKVIILVNQNSISYSEFSIMAFQTAKTAITIGNQTAGADGNVVSFYYLGGYKTTFSGLGVFYPDGTETQRKGIKIDIEVKQTIKGLREGRDEVLEKALEVIFDLEIKNN